MEVVAVLGASSDPNRYSYKAIEILKEYGHRPIPVTPKEKEVLGYGTVEGIKQLVGESIDTLTVYVNPAISDKYTDDIVALKPKRVIFNPGAENFNLEKALVKAGIEVENACTLVLLRTNQF